MSISCIIFRHVLYRRPVMSFRAAVFDRGFVYLLMTVNFIWYLEGNLDISNSIWPRFRGNTVCWSSRDVSTTTSVQHATSVSCASAECWTGQWEVILKKLQNEAVAIHTWISSDLGFVLKQRFWSSQQNLNLMLLTFVATVFYCCSCILCARNSRFRECLL